MAFHFLRRRVRHAGVNVTVVPTSVVEAGRGLSRARVHVIQGVDERIEQTVRIIGGESMATLPTWWLSMGPYYVFTRVFKDLRVGRIYLHIRQFRVGGRIYAEEGSPGTDANYCVYRFFRGFLLWVGYLLVRRGPVFAPGSRMQLGKWPLLFRISPVSKSGPSTVLITSRESLPRG